MVKIAWGVLFLMAPALAKEPPWNRWQAQSRRSQLAPAAEYLKSARGAQAIFLAQGGLVHLPEDVPTVILPDLHAQRDYLTQVLQLPMQGTTVFALLQQGKVNVLCLGDGMHSEQRAEARWLQAEKDYLQHQSSPSMKAEMVESLGLLQLVMDLKVAYPKHFFFVRGNHEDMDPERPYRKMTQVGESNLVKAWVQQNLGNDFLKQWHQCEQSMPLVAVGGSFVGSHAAPEQPVRLADLQSRTSTAFRSCCWSDNTVWPSGGSEFSAFEDNCKRLGVTAGRPWIVGHRKVVDAPFRLQCEGKLVQINPLDSQPRVVAIAPPRGQPFVPKRDIRYLP